MHRLALLEKEVLQDRLGKKGGSLATETVGICVSLGA